MWTPASATCIVCEEVRQERFGKATILGFYGIAPSVQIKVRELAHPIERLLFLWILGRPNVTEKAEAFVEMINPDGGLIGERLGPLPLVVQAGKTMQVATGFGNVTFPGLGAYRVRLQVNGKWLDGAFEVAQAVPEDFAV